MLFLRRGSAVTRGIIAVCVVFAAAALLLFVVSRTDTKVNMYNDTAVIDRTSSVISRSAEPYVYWSEFGTKYHASESCPYLKNADSISSGTVESAEQRGLSPCSGCIGSD